MIRSRARVPLPDPIPRHAIISNRGAVALHEPIGPLDRVVLCFLTLGPLPFADTHWNTWVGAGDEVEASSSFGIVIHPKDASLVPPHLQSNVCSRIVPTSWGTASLVQAMIQLLRDGLERYPDASHFQFLSESCVPIRSPTAYRATLLRDISFFLFTHLDKGRHTLFWKRWRRRLYSASQWSCVCRAHAEMFVRAERALLEPLERTGFGKEYVPDEIAFVTFLANSKPIPGVRFVNRMITYIKWPKHEQTKDHEPSHRRHPITYDEDQVFSEGSEVMKDAYRLGACFLRKVRPSDAR